jgi:transcriptional regulator with XRE-family HTH domain
MSHKATLPIPVQAALRKLGRDISDARRRRRITMALMGQRADLGRATIRKIERGDPAVSMGSYAAVVFVLGMTDRLKDLIDANHDLVGRGLEEENLPKRVRLPRAKKLGGGK